MNKPTITRTYYPSNNGETNYKVIISPDKIAIYDISCDFTDINCQTKNKTNPPLLLTIKQYQKVFIGRNSAKMNKIYKDTFIGTSILVEIKPLQYLFIRTKLEAFTTKEPIEKFVSLMGNNFVTYPFAMTKNEVYLLIEGKYLHRKDYDNTIDPYAIYYDFQKTYNVKSFNFHIKTLNNKNIASFINLHSVSGPRTGTK